MFAERCLHATGNGLSHEAAGMKYLGGGGVLPQHLLSGMAKCVEGLLAHFKSTVLVCSKGASYLPCALWGFLWHLMGGFVRVSGSAAARSAVWGGAASG